MPNVVTPSAVFDDCGLEYWVQELGELVRATVGTPSLRVLDVLSQENRVSILFEFLEDITGLKYRASWLFYIDEGKIIKIIGLRREVPL